MLYDSQKYLSVMVLSVENLVALLAYLNRNYYSKKMKPEDAPLCRLTARDIAERKDTIAEREIRLHMGYGEKVIWRTNHGAVHHYRSAAYVPWVVDFFRQFGRKDIVSKLKRFDERAILKLQVCMAFSSIRRESEVDFYKQPETHRYYRENAAKLFQTCYDQYQRIKREGGLMPRWLATFSCFDGVTDFKKHKEALNVMGDPENENVIHILINVCHKLDLIRCRAGSYQRKTVDLYIRRFMKRSSENGYFIFILKRNAARLINVTGDAIGTSRLKYKNALQCYNNQNVANFVKVLNKTVTREDLLYRSRGEIEQKSEDHAGFYFKWVSSRKFDAVVGLCDDAFRTSVNNERYKNRRIKPRRNYIIKDGRVIDRHVEDPGSATPEQESAYSSPMSLSYAREGYMPPAVARGTGFAFQERDVLTRRFYLYAGSSNARRYEFKSKKEAEKIMARFSFQFPKNVDALVANGITDYANEAVGRVRDISGVLIFTDTPEYRMEAIFRANYVAYRKRILAHTEAECPIAFYTSTRADYSFPGELKEYRFDEQKADYEKAVSDAELWFENMKSSYDVLRLTFNERFDIKPSHEQAAKGNIDYFKSNPAIDINATDTRGKTPLHYAAQNGHIDLVVYLLNKGAHIVADQYEGGDTFFTATLRIGRFDYALNLLAAIDEHGLNVPLITHSSQVKRFLKIKNKKVIQALVAKRIIPFKNPDGGYVLDQWLSIALLAKKSQDQQFFIDMLNAMKCYCHKIIDSLYERRQYIILDIVLGRMIKIFREELAINECGPDVVALFGKYLKLLEQKKVSERVRLDLDVLRVMRSRSVMDYTRLEKSLKGEAGHQVNVLTPHDDGSLFSYAVSIAVAPCYLLLFLSHVSIQRKRQLPAYVQACELLYSRICERTIELEQNVMLDAMLEKLMQIDIHAGLELCGEKLKRALMARQQYCDDVMAKQLYHIVCTSAKVCLRHIAKRERDPRVTVSGGSVDGDLRQGIVNLVVSLKDKSLEQQMILLLKSLDTVAGEFVKTLEASLSVVSLGGFGQSILDYLIFTIHGFCRDVDITLAKSQSAFDKMRWLRALVFKETGAASAAVAAAPV